MSGALAGAPTEGPIAAADSASYRVSCAGCYSNLQVFIHAPARGAVWMAAEERRQMELDGWCYLKGDYAICPGCTVARTSELAA